LTKTIYFQPTTQSNIVDFVKDFNDHHGLTVIVKVNKWCSYF